MQFLRAMPVTPIPNYAVREDLLGDGYQIEAMKDI